MEEASGSARGRLGEALLLAALGGLAFAVRCLNYGGVFVGSDVVFYGVDSYGHMRRIALAVQAFPRVPTFDYFLNYPGGADIPWPVGFDFLLALAGWLAGGLGPPARSTLETACALAIPALGALNVLLVYWVGRRFFGALPALLAGVLLSLFKAHASISQIGRVDHHVVEPFFVPLIFLFFVGSLDGTAGGRDGDRAWRRRAIVAGAAAGGSCLFWAGATVFAALPGLFVLLCFALRGRPVPGPEAARRAAVLYAAGAAVLALGGPTSPFFLRFEFTPLALSWFHLLAFLLGAAACALLGRPGPAGGGRGWRAFTLACVAAAAALTAAGVATPGGWQSLGKAFLYVAARDPLAGTTVEAQRLAELGTAGLAWAFTRLWMLAPLALLAVLWREARSGFASAPAAFLLLWLLASALLAGGQFVRYYPHLAAPLALLLGLGLARAGGAAWHGLWRAEGGAAQAAGAALLAATVLLPAYLLSDRVLELRPTRVINHAWEFPSARHAFEWLRAASPDPGGVRDPGVKPRYGVLAPWGFGFWINYIAERPNIASPNLLLPREVAGARAALAVLLAEDEQSAAEGANDLGARYVVATNLYRYLPDFTRALGQPLERFMTRRGEAPDEIYHFKEPFFRTLNNRMLLFDGAEAPGFGVTALGRFRMVYESPRLFQWASIPQEPEVALGDVETSVLKIFERVPGARLEGKARPLATVRAVAVIRTNRGRRFEYRTSARCDESGAFTLRLPYATDGAPAIERTSALGPYEITGAGARRSVRVSEAAVVEGGRVLLQDARAARPPRRDAARAIPVR